MPIVFPEASFSRNKWASALKKALFHFTTSLETGQNPCSEPVSVGVLDKAWQLAHYLLDHAKQAFGAMHQEPGEKEAQAILLWARREGLREFTRRTVQREGPYRRSSQLDTALDLLVASGWVENVSRIASTRGRGYRVLFWPELDLSLPLATFATNALSKEKHST